MPKKPQSSNENWHPWYTIFITVVIVISSTIGGAIIASHYQVEFWKQKNHHEFITRNINEMKLLLEAISQIPFH